MNDETTILDPQTTAGAPKPAGKETSKGTYAAGGAAAGGAAGIAVGVAGTIGAQAVAANIPSIDSDKEAEEAGGAATNEPVITSADENDVRAANLNQNNAFFSQNSADAVLEGNMSTTDNETSTADEHRTADTGAAAQDDVEAQPDILPVPEDTEDPVHIDPVEDMPIPEPEDSILATATGVRVAQVDDDASFAQAFADARAQVGPGGIFEWHGRVYGTYYKEEWAAMSPAERQEFQANIDYTDVIPDGGSEHGRYDIAEDSSQHTDAGSDLSAETSTEGEVHVIEVGEYDLDGDGSPEDVAFVEVNNQPLILVDIDQDGTADIAIADVDGDGEPDFCDLTGENMAMPTQSDGDAYLAQADDMPDYMNDANIDMA